MQGLGMQGGKFEVALGALDQPAQYGLEQAEFLAAPWATCPNAAHPKC